MISRNTACESRLALVLVDLFVCHPYSLLLFTVLLIRLQAWAEFLGRYCLPDPSLPTTLHNAGISGLERKESWLQPLFTVELIVAAGKIDFAPSVEELHK